MREMILCKLGEVVLKGLNRRSFEDKLIGNLRRRTAKCGNFRIYSKQSTIYVEPVNDESDLTAAYAACKQVFGVIAVSRALPCEKDVQAIIRTAKDYLAPEFARAKDFKVESKRADKTFPLTSIQLSQQVGGALHQAFPRCAVNVHDPELTVFIELRDDAAYVHGPAEAGAGGLPIGMGGSAVSLLSGGIDSPVASYMMAKRGVSLEMVHFFSPPYTSDAAKEKVLELAQLLTPWCGRLTVHIVPFTEIQEQIRMNCPDGPFHAHHAPLHDAPCPARGRRGARQGARHRRMSRAGRQPDDGGSARERGCGGAARPAPSHRHGQGGDHPHLPKDRHVRHVHSPL